MPPLAHQSDADAVSPTHRPHRAVAAAHRRDLDFVHRTFQDYLGAQAAIEAADMPLLIHHAHDTQWEDVVRMAIAHARPMNAPAYSPLVDRGDRTASTAPSASAGHGLLGTRNRT